jgi:hypothetical protein
MRKNDPELLEVRNKINELLDKHPDMELYMLGWLKDTIHRIKEIGETTTKKKEKLDDLLDVVGDSVTVSHQRIAAAAFLMMKGSVGISKEQPGAYSKKHEAMKIWDKYLTMIATMSEEAFQILVKDATLAVDAIEKLHHIFGEIQEEEE